MHQKGVVAGIQRTIWKSLQGMSPRIIDALTPLPTVHTIQTLSNCNMPSCDSTTPIPELLATASHYFALIFAVTTQHADFTAGTGPEGWLWGGGANGGVEVESSAVGARGRGR